MPYATIAELPPAIRSKYSDKAQEAFLNAFNGVLEQTKDEGRAMAAGHAAAQKVDGAAPKAPPFVKEQVTILEGPERSHFYIDTNFIEKPWEHDGTHKASVTVIKPGLSKNDFYYSRHVLSQLPNMLEGAKAYLDHEKKSEIKDRGGRSIRDIAGWYSDVYQESTGEIRATLNFAPGTEKIVEMLRVNPSLVGLSINAKGKAARGSVDGRQAMIAESFEKLYSTDLVTEAAAGGEVEMVASVKGDNVMDNEEMKDQEIREAELEKEYMDKTAWLIAERDHKINVLSWLAAERDHKIETERRAEVIESVMRDIPEHTREYFRRLVESAPLEKIKDEADGFLNILKGGPAVIKDNPPASSEKGSGPGTEGYKRKLLL